MKTAVMITTLVCALGGLCYVLLISSPSDTHPGVVGTQRLTASPLHGRLDFRAREGEEAEMTEAEEAKVEAEADRFFEGLIERYGERFHLELTLTSSTQREGYELTLFEDDSYEDEGVKATPQQGCPQLPQRPTSYELTLHHPSHYHAPLTLKGAGRLSCRQLKDEQGERLELKVSEPVIAVHELIPTAIDHTLYSILSTPKTE